MLFSSGSLEEEVLRREEEDDAIGRTPEQIEERAGHFEQKTNQQVGEGTGWQSGPCYSSIG